MTSDTLPVPERIDVVKLVKVVAIKAAQLIVQSRDGNKVQTKCNPNSSGHSMFNLAFRELFDIEKEARRALANASNSETRWSLCVEIFLKTIDGDVMTLETWNVSLSSDYYDNINAYTLYSRFGIIIKSLLAVTRVVPAYRYSRRQSSDSYIIGHKIYGGEAMCNSLGDKYKYIKVGAVATPIGTWQMSVAYRTNMTISPQPSSIETLVVKSDHFRPDFSPKPNRNQPSDENNSLTSEDSNYKMLGAFVESRRESLIPTDSDDLIPNLPFSSLLSARASQQQSPTNAVNGNDLCARLKAIDFDKDDQNGNVTVTKSATSNNDFIVVDLVKPPFAEPSGNIELGTFYQEWKAAPPLQACPTDPKVIDQVGDLTSQLASYETSLKEFDSMVTSLCDESDSNENISPMEL